MGSLIVEVGVLTGISWLDRFVESGAFRRGALIAWKWELRADGLLSFSVDFTISITKLYSLVTRSSFSTTPVDSNLVVKMNWK
jgi:hypothetical protein